jgi:cytochrome P450
MLKGIRQHLESSDTIDLQPLFFDLALDSITTFLLGKPAESFRSKEPEFTRAFTTAQDYIAQRFRLQDFCWLIGGRKMREACELVHEFAAATIHQYREAPNDVSFLSVIKDSFTDDNLIRDHVVNILFAGRDTTASLLSWTL